MTVVCIYGPMFAGKSSALIEKARAYEAKHGNKYMIMLKYSKDTRYNSNNYVISHNKESYPAKPVDSLSEISDEELIKYKKIFIDEGQFFNDIITFINRCTCLNVHVVIAGLNLNHKRNVFGQMGSVIDISDKSIMLTSTCVDCGNTAHYTRMNSQSEDILNADIAIGGQELYSPVCNDCI